MIRVIKTDGGKTTAGFTHETRDCAVRAIAIATETSYAEVHAKLKLQGRRNRQGTSINQIQAALRSLTAETETIYTVDFGGLYSHITYPTLADTLRKYQTGRYVVITTDHAQAVIDGVVHDDGLIAGPRSRVKRVFRVVPKQKQAAQPDIMQDQINELWARLDRLEARTR